MAASDRKRSGRATSPRVGTKAAIVAAGKRLKKAQAGAELLKNGSDATRLRVILLLAEGEAHNGTLCAAIGMSQPAMSHHLALLRHGRIVDAIRRGRHVFYRLTASGHALAGAVAAILP